MKFLPRQQLTRVIIYSLFFSLTACSMSQRPIGNPQAPYPPEKSLAVGDIYHLPTGVKITAGQMTGAITDSRIIYVGETHDNPASQRLELQILKAMAERYPGEVSLGMEMFNHEQQPALNDWVAGKLSEKEFLKAANWQNVWSQDFTYYRDLLQFARDHRLPVIGLNITKELRRKVAMTPLDELDAETRAQLPAMDFGDRYQRALTEAIYADHSQGGKMLDGFLRVQTLSDEGMAEAIVKTLTEADPGHRMVVIAGGNHIRYGFGIPRRVYRRLPTSYLLIGSRELVIPKEKEKNLMNVVLPHFPMPPYDYMVYTEYESLPGERVKLGILMQEEAHRVVVATVVPESTADKAGLLPKDILIALDEVVIEESFDLIYELNQRVIGERATLTIERDGMPLKLELIFTPLAKSGNHGATKEHKKQ